jgi:MFS family permease
MEEITYPKFRWFVLFTMFIVTAATLTLMIAPAPLAGEISKGLGVDLGVVLAISMMCFTLAVGVSALFGGFITDKIGLVPMWIASSIVEIIATLLFPVFGHSVAGFLILRVIQGLSTGPIQGSIASCCAQRFKYSERTYVAAVQGFSISIGIAIGLVYSPAMFNATQSWLAALGWMAVLPAIGLVFAVIVLFGPKPTVVGTCAEGVGNNSLFSSDLKRALTYITIYVLAIMGFIDSWCQQAYNDMATGFYAVAPPVGLGLGPMGAGSKLMFASYAMALGTLAAPVITEKIFRGNAKPTICIGCGVAASLVLLIRFLHADNTALLIMVPCGILFFSSFVNPTIFGYIAKHYPSTIAGRLGGFVMGVTIFGATTGLAISSYLLHRTGFYWASMDVLAGVTFAGAIIVLVLRPPKGFSVAADAAAATKKNGLET